MSFPILTTLVVVPAIGGLLLLLVPQLRAVARTFALTVAGLELILVLVAALNFDKSAAGTVQFSEVHSWIPQLGASWALGVSGVGLILLVLAGVLVPLTMLAEWRDDFDGKAHRYLGLILITQAFMVGLFSARDVLLFYVLFEAMLLPLYFLIGGFGGAQSRYAAVKFLIFSLVGGLVMLVAVISLYFVGPGGEQAFLTENLVGNLEFSAATEKLLFLGFFLAFAIKAPLVPVHTWLPTVAETARPGTTALLVAVLDKVGTFGMLTLALPLFPGAAKWAAPVIIGLAVFSVIYGALAAIGQENVLRLISFTSISHFGIMVLGIFAFTQTAVEGASFYMFNHGLSTGALFLLAGFMLRRHGSVMISEFGGWQRAVPVLSGTFLIVGLSALALPGMSPFVSEIMVLIGAFKVAPVAVIVAAVSVVLSALYILLTYQRIFTGPAPSAPVREISIRERVAVWPLIVLMLVLGFFPNLALDYVREPAGTAVAVVSQEVGQ